MTEQIKKKGGRPRKEPTYCKGFRVSGEMFEFLKTLENQNRFIVDLISETKQYKDFVLQKRINDNSPSLF